MAIKRISPGPDALLFLPVSGKKFLLYNFWPDDFRRPKLTLKIILSLLMLLTLLSFISFSWLVLLLADLLLPLIIPAVLLVLFIPASLIHQIIIFLASRKRLQFPNLIVIGVTGSFAKTTTKDALAAVLSLKYRVLQTPGTQNTLIGIASTILRRLTARTEIFIVEMGAYRRGEIKAMCNLVKPQIGILTGINEQHLDLFGSLENIKAAKYELIDSLPKDGLAIFNSHALAALAVAKHLGVPRSAALKALQSIKADRINQFTRRNITFLDDSYSSNPAGFQLALDRLGQLPGKKLIITPGIIELGSASHPIHQRLGQLMARLKATVILTNPDFQSDLAKSLKNLLVLEKPSQVINFLKTHQKDFPAVLLEGRLPQSIIKYFKL